MVVIKGRQKHQLLYTCYNAPTRLLQWEAIEKDQPERMDHWIKPAHIVAVAIGKYKESIWQTTPEFTWMEWSALNNAGYMLWFLWEAEGK